MIGRNFSGWAMLILAGAAVVGFVAGALVGRQKGSGLFWTWDLP